MLAITDWIIATLGWTLYATLILRAVAMSLLLRRARSSRKCFTHPRDGAEDVAVAMVRVVFTQNIQRHVDCPIAEVRGATVREVLDRVFERNERARLYVLDDQHELRRHMLVFVNGKQVADRRGLSDPVPADGEVYVMQALSGG
jgi:hypothetical protein